jgi:hypothetical protein
MTDLRQALDAALPPAGHTPSAYTQVVARARRLRRRRRMTRMSAPLLACALVAVAITTALPGPEASGETRIALHGRAVQTRQGLGSVWTLTCDLRCGGAGKGSRGRILRVEPRTATIKSAMPVSGAQDFAVGSDSVWVANFYESTVVRLDPDTGETVAEIKLALPEPVAADDTRFLPVSIAAAKDAVWVSSGRGYVARIDPRTNRVTARIATPADASGNLVASSSEATVAASVFGVVHIDADSGAATTEVVSGPHDTRLAVDQLATAGGTVWAYGTLARKTTDDTGHTDWTLTDTQEVTALPATGGRRSRLLRLTPAGRWNIAYGDGQLWAANFRSGALRQLSERGRLSHTTLRVQGPGTLVAVTRHAVWATTPSGILRKISSRREAR